MGSKDDILAFYCRLSKILYPKQLEVISDESLNRGTPKMTIASGIILFACDQLIKAIGMAKLSVPPESYPILQKHFHNIVDQLKVQIDELMNDATVSKEALTEEIIDRILKRYGTPSS